MTRNEYESLIMDREREREHYKYDLLNYYDKVLRPLDNQRTDTQCHIRSAHYGETPSLIPSLKIEVNKLTQQILNLENENNSNFKQKMIDDLDNEIRSLKANALIELNPWEYYTSDIISDPKQQAIYIDSYGIGKVIQMGRTRPSSMFILTDSFDYECGADILEKLSPFLCSEDIVTYLPSNMRDSNIHIEYNDSTGLWKVFMDETEELMEHKDCNEILQYFNLIR